MLKKKHSLNSFIVCRLAFCPGPPDRDHMGSEKQLRVYTSGSTMACHMWHVDKAPGHTRRNRNACLKVLRLSMGKIFAGTVYTASDANWLKHLLMINMCTKFTPSKFSNNTLLICWSDNLDLKLHTHFAVIFGFPNFHETFSIISVRIPSLDGFSICSILKDVMSTNHGPLL